MSAVESIRVSRVLIRGITWYIDNLAIVIPISFIAVLPELVCYLIFASEGTDGGDGVAEAFVTQWVSVLAGTWLMGLLMHAAVTSISSGRKPSLNDSLWQSARVFFPLLLLSLLLGVAIVLGILLLIIPGLVLIVMFWVAVPALVVERRGILESFGRSRELTAGHRWKVLWVFLSEVLVSIVLAALLGIVFYIWTWVTSGGTQLDEWSILTQPRSPVMQSLYWVLPFGVSTAITAASFVELRSLASAGGNFR